MRLLRLCQGTQVVIQIWETSVPPSVVTTRPTGSSSAMASASLLVLRPSESKGDQTFGDNSTGRSSLGSRNTEAVTIDGPVE